MNGLAHSKYLKILKNFLALEDTPDSFEGQGGKFVAVTSGSSALEFVDAPSGGGSTETDVLMVQVFT
jgi:hypothetical protein